MNCFQDQDSGYDGFCPEKSLYSTTSSDTSSVLSSSDPEPPAASPHQAEPVYTRPRPRPRPSPIYEKHEVN